MGIIINISRVFIRSIARGAYLYTMQCFNLGGTEQVKFSKTTTVKWIVPTFPANAVLRMGTAPGLDDIMPDTDIIANQPFPIEIGFVSNTDGGDTIYVTGTVPNGYINFYRF